MKKIAKFLGFGGDPSNKTQQEVKKSADTKKGRGHQDFATGYGIVHNRTEMVRRGVTDNPPEHGFPTEGSWELKDINKNITEVEKFIQKKSGEIERNEQARKGLRNYILENIEDINKVIVINEKIASITKLIDKTGNKGEKEKIKKRLDAKVHELGVQQRKIRASSKYSEAMNYLKVLEPNKYVHIEDSNKINSILERSKNTNNALKQQLGLMQLRLQDLKESRSEGLKQLGKSDFLSSGFDNLPSSSGVHDQLQPEPSFYRFQPEPSSSQAQKPVNVWDMYSRGLLSGEE